MHYKKVATSSSLLQRFKWNTLTRLERNLVLMQSIPSLIATATSNTQPSRPLFSSQPTPKGIGTLYSFSKSQAFNAIQTQNSSSLSQAYIESLTIQMGLERNNGLPESVVSTGLQLNTSLQTSPSSFDGTQHFLSELSKTHPVQYEFLRSISELCQAAYIHTPNDAKLKEVTKALSPWFGANVAQVMILFYHQVFESKVAINGPSPQFELTEENRLILSHAQQQYLDEDSLSLKTIRALHSIDETQLPFQTALSLIMDTDILPSHQQFISLNDLRNPDGLAPLLREANRLFNSLEGNLTLKPTVLRCIHEYFQESIHSPEMRSLVHELKNTTNAIELHLILDPTSPPLQLLLLVDGHKQTQQFQTKHATEMVLHLVDIDHHSTAGPLIKEILPPILRGDSSAVVHVNSIRKSKELIPIIAKKIQESAEHFHKSAETIVSKLTGTLHALVTAPQFETHASFTIQISHDTPFMEAEDPHRGNTLHNVKIDENHFSPERERDKPKTIALCTFQSLMSDLGITNLRDAGQSLALKRPIPDKLIALIGLDQPTPHHQINTLLTEYTLAVLKPSDNIATPEMIGTAFNTHLLRNSLMPIDLKVRFKENTFLEDQTEFRSTDCLPKGFSIEIPGITSVVEISRKQTINDSNSAIHALYGRDGTTPESLFGTTNPTKARLHISKKVDSFLAHHPDSFDLKTLIPNIIRDRSDINYPHDNLTPPEKVKHIFKEVLAAHSGIADTQEYTPLTVAELKLAALSRTDKLILILTPNPTDVRDMSIWKSSNSDRCPDMVIVNIGDSRFERWDVGDAAAHRDIHRSTPPRSSVSTTQANKRSSIASLLGPSLWGRGSDHGTEPRESTVSDAMPVVDLSSAFEATTNTQGRRHSTAGGNQVNPNKQTGRRFSLF